MRKKKQEKRKKRLMVIDGNALIHRAFHALPLLKTKKGELVNGVYGFFLIFLKAIRELKPDFIAATFDLPGETFRQKKYKEYKAKRPKAPKELYQQLSRVKKILRDFGLPIYEKQGFEADDVIGTVTKRAPKRQILPEIETTVLTGDLDTLQLVDKNTNVYTMRRGLKETILYDEKRVRERYGLSPSQLVDFKALKGDPSDNIPGIPGIGKKRAAKLLKKFGSLENIYKKIETREMEEKFKKILQGHKDQAEFSRALVKIRRDVPIEFNLKDCKFEDFDREKIRKDFEDLGFYTLIRQIPSIKTGITFKKTEEKRILQQVENLYKERIFSKKIYEIEKNLIPVVEKMEKAGIKINKKGFETLSKKLNKEILALEKKIYNLAGVEFNINSPKQLAKVLFEKLKLPVKDLRKTPTGEISTAWPELKKIRGEHKIIDLIRRHRKLFKLKSSFVEPLPGFVKKDGRIHPKFHQLGTETGRFSCSDPNLQNVPIRGDLGKAIRRCFVTKEGYKLASFDYSQMELRIAAVLAKDEKMIKFFKEGKDIHRMTAAELFDVSEKEVKKREREIAKRLNFGVLYGIGAQSLAETAKISLKEARDFIDQYFKKFEKITEFLEKCVKKAREKGFSETIFGRKRLLPEINSSDLRLRSSAERMAKNFPIQGLGADIMKKAMVDANQILRGFKSQAKMILQIHDELLFEIKEDKIKKITPKIKKIMEQVVSWEIPLKVEVKVGENWAFES